MPRRILGYRAQTRSRIIAYTVTIGLMLLIVASVQVTIPKSLCFFGAVPDLMICTVLCVAYFCGRYAGAITGIAAGFIIEAIGSRGISLLPVVYMIGAYVAGHYARTVKPKRYTIYLFFLACALFVRAGVTVVYACMNYKTVHLLKILLYTVLPEMGGTAIAGLILFFPVCLVCRLLERK